MNSGLKTGLVVALIGAVIFGATVLSQLSPKTDPQKTKEGDGANPVVPLDFGFTDYRYNPSADDVVYHHRWFNGFFEVGTGGTNTSRRNWVGFVMRNVRKSAADLSPLTPSCSKCTSARVASVSPASMQNYFSHAAAGNAFSSPFVMNPLALLAWAQTVSQLDWFMFDFSQPDRMFRIPPGESTPTWVLLELDFKVEREEAPREVKAWFDLFDEKKERLIPAPFDLKVTFAGREPFETWPKEINMGELPDGAEPRTFDLYLFSMTRDHFTAPSSLVEGNDPTVSLGPPAQLNLAECEQLATKLSVEMKAPVLVRSAYRQALTVRRDTPGNVPEAGEFEKFVHFANDKLSPRTTRLLIKGQVVGAVRIDGASKLELGDYKSEFAMSKEFRLMSDNPDIDLEIVKDRCEPAFVQLSLGPPEVAFGRKTWKLTASIAEQQGRRPPWTGVVIIRTKGANAATFRFPITGHGR